MNERIAAMSDGLLKIIRDARRCLLLIESGMHEKAAWSIRSTAGCNCVTCESLQNRLKQEQKRREVAEDKEGLEQYRSLCEERNRSKPHPVRCWCWCNDCRGSDRKQREDLDKSELSEMDHSAGCDCKVCSGIRHAELERRREARTKGGPIKPGHRQRTEVDLTEIIRKRGGPVVSEFKQPRQCSCRNCEARRVKHLGQDCNEQ